jgi:hypothetical protein
MIKCRFNGCILFFICFLKAAGQNPPCSDVDFEAFNTGPLPLTAISWTISERNNDYLNPIMCPVSQITFSSPVINNNAFIMQTPLVDPVIGTVPNSPLGGGQVVVINRNFPLSIRQTCLRNNFMVSAAAPIYKYAFIAGLQTGEDCCGGPSAIFRFYDCSGNLIAPLSKKYTPNPPLCITNPTPSCIFSKEFQWSSIPTSPITFYNPTWEVGVANLSAYVGSCITVEVIASNCTGAAHQGYIYYDAKCTSDVLFPGENPAANAASNYTSCSGVTLLTGPGCFSSYLWQGPATSSVNGLSTQTVNTNISGIYTLTVTQGALSLSQTLSVTISPGTLPVSINSSTNAGCEGVAVQLLASGGAANNYTWSNGSNAYLITVTPSVTTVYSVTSTNSLNCTSSDTKTITIYPIPIVQLISQPSVCIGGTVSISAVGGTLLTYNWNNGFSSNSIVVTPTMNSVYTLTVTDLNGCFSINSKSVTVRVTVVNISPATITICPFQKINLYAFGSSLASYTWSSGSSGPLLVVTPSLTTVYSVSVTDSFGCFAQANRQVAVSSCLSISEEALQKPSIDISPNPGQGSVMINSSHTTKCIITDAVGRQIESFVLNRENNFEFTFFTPVAGVYFLITSFTSRKFILE